MPNPNEPEQPKKPQPPMGKPAQLPQGAKQAEGALFEAKHLQVGKVAPDFSAVDQDGKPFKLSNYRGKVVVVDFWGFW